MTKYQKIIAFVFLHLIATSFSQNQFEFFIDNTYSGQNMDGTFESPFRSVNQSSPFIQSISNASLIFYLAPTDYFYPIYLESIDINSLLLEKCLNCSSSSEENYARISFDLVINRSNFSLSLVSIEIVNSNFGSQGVVIIASRLNFYFTNVLLSTSQPTSYLFQADYIQGTISDFVFNAASLSNPFMNVSASSEIYISILSFYYGQSNSGIMSLSGSSYNANTTFILQNSSILGSQSSTETVQASLFILSNISTIKIVDVNLAYYSANYASFVINGGFKEILVSGINLSMIDSSDFGWMILNVEDENMESSLNIDSLLISDSIIGKFIQLNNSSNLQVNISLGNINVTNSTASSLFEFNFDYPTVEDQTINFIFQDVFISDSYLEKIVVYEFAQMSPNFYYMNFTNIFIQKSRSLATTDDPLSMWFKINLINTSHILFSNISIIDVFLNSNYFIVDNSPFGSTKMTKLKFKNSTIIDDSIFYQCMAAFYPQSQNEKILHISYSEFSNINAGFFGYMIMTTSIYFDISYNIFQNVQMSYYRNIFINQNLNIIKLAYQSSNITNNIYTDLPISYSYFMEIQLLDVIYLNISSNIYHNIECNYQFMNLGALSQINLIMENEILGSSLFAAQVFFIATSYINMTFSKAINNNNTFNYFFVSNASRGTTFSEFYCHNSIFANINSQLMFQFNDYGLINLNLSQIIGSNITLSPTLPQSSFLSILNSNLEIGYFESVYLTGIYHQPLNLANALATPRMYLFLIEKSNLCIFNGFKLKNLIIGLNLTNLIVIEEVLNLTMNEVYFENLYILNSFGYPIEISTPLLQISNFELINPVLIMYSIYDDSEGFFQNNFVNDQVLKVSMSNLYIKRWKSNFPVINLVSPMIMIIVTNLTAVDSHDIFSFSSYGGSYLYSDIKLINSEGTFMKTTNTSDSKAVINGSNFVITSPLMINGRAFQFEIFWDKITITLTNISISASALLKVDSIFGDINIKTFVIQGYVESSIFQIKFKSSQTKTSSVILSRGLIVESYAGDLLNIDIIGSSQVSLFNVIFDNAVSPIKSNKNTSIEMSNIIMTRTSVLETGIGTLQGVIELSRAENLTLYNLAYADVENYLFELKDRETTLTSMVVCRSSPILLKGSRVMIENSAFAFNYNFKSKGGCIQATSNSFMNIISSSFVNNFAITGGAIYLDNSALDQDNLYLSLNQGILYGDNFASQPCSIVLSIKNFQHSNSLFQEYEAVNFELITSNYQNSQYKISNASSAFALSKLFKVTLFDFYNQTIQYDQNIMSLLLRLSNPTYSQSLTLLNPNPNISSSFEFLASNISIPSVFHTESIQIQVLIDSYQLSILLEIESRDCLPGEQILSGATCGLCPQNYFNLEANESCIDCPDGAVCPGGKFIHAKPYYWIEPKSSLVYSCINDGVERCQGSIDTYHQCLEGYSGGLCLGCNYTGSYSQDSGHTCSNCSDSLFWLIFNSASMFLLSFAYELGILYSSYKSNKNYLVINKKNELEQNFQVNNLILITNTFLQIVSIISGYIWNIETPLLVALDQLEFLLSIASIQPQNIANFPCLLLRLGGEPDEITYIQIYIQALLPFVKIILLSAILLIRNSKKKVKNLEGKIIWIIVTFISLDQTGILLYVSKFSLCVIGDLEGYSLLDPNIKCSDERYISFYNDYIYPTILFWGVLVPVVFTLYFYLLRNRIQEPNVRRILGSMMNNYKDEVFYWNLVIMYLKMSMIIILIYLNPKNASNLCMCISLAFLYFLIKKKPLRENTLNRLNEIAALAIFFILYLFNQALGNSQDSVVTLYVVLITVTILFMSCIVIFKLALTVRRQYLEKKSNRNKSSLIDGKSTSLDETSRVMI